MQPDRAARYQSSAELRRDLEKIQTEPAVAGEARGIDTPGSAGILAGVLEGGVNK